MNGGKKFKERVVVLGPKSARVEFSLLPNKALSQKWLSELVAEHGGEDVSVHQEWTNSTVGHFSSGWAITVWSRPSGSKWTARKMHHTNG